MKKILVVSLVLIIAGGAAFAQQSQEVPNPSASLTFNIGYSALAPIGVSLEFFPFQSIGIGGMLNGFFFGSDAWSINPGGFIRYYLGEIDGTLFFNAGISYLTVGSVSDSIRLMQIRGGLGYNNIIGRKNQNRILIEIGVVYQKFVSGEDEDDEDDLLPALPYFGISIGQVF